MNESVRCRLCGYQLKSTSGCSVCTPVKTALVWPVLTDELSDTSAISIINSTLRALKRRLGRLDVEIKSEARDYNKDLTRDLATIARTLKELAAEKRKLEDREADEFAQLGIEGRLNLMVEQFFAQLPEDFQVKLLTRMREVYIEQNSSALSSGQPTEFLDE